MNPETQNKPTAQALTEPLNPAELELLAAETASILPFKDAIVAALLKVAEESLSPSTALWQLLAALPEPIHEAALRRFRYEIGLIENKRRATPRRAGLLVKNQIFDMAGAVLLMASGTYEKIRDLARQQPALRNELQSLGHTILQHGTVPDMAMLAKLQAILLKAQQEQSAEKQTPSGS